MQRGAQAAASGRVRSVPGVQSQVRIAVEDNDGQVKDGLILLTNLLVSREKLWFNQMADEDKKKVELETQQVVTKTIIFYVTIVKN